MNWQWCARLFKGTNHDLKNWNRVDNKTHVYASLRDNQLSTKLFYMFTQPLLKILLKISKTTAKRKMSKNRLKNTFWHWFSHCILDLDTDKEAVCIRVSWIFWFCWNIFYGKPFASWVQNFENYRNRLRIKVPQGLRKLWALSQMSIYWAEKCQKTHFFGKKSKSLWPFCTQPISIFCTIFDSGSKGLSILNIVSGSAKIQLTLACILLTIGWPPWLLLRLLYLVYWRYDECSVRVLPGSCGAKKWVPFLAAMGVTTWIIGWLMLITEFSFVVCDLLPIYVHGQGWSDSQ